MITTTSPGFSGPSPAPPPGISARRRLRSGDFSQIAFNQTYENINLNVEVVSWNDIYTVVNTRLSGDKAPEV